MLSVYRTLSVRYLGRRWVRAMLIVLTIALGVATLVATRALNETMTKAGLATVNPMAGLVDLLVMSGTKDPIDGKLADQLRKVPGVQHALPRIYRNIKLPDLDGQSVMFLGLDPYEELKAYPELGLDRDHIVLLRTIAKNLPFNITPAIVGKELDAQLHEATRRLKEKADRLPKDQKLSDAEQDRLARAQGIWIPGYKTFPYVRIEKPKQAGEKEKKHENLVQFHVLETTGKLAVLAGNVIILDLPFATKVLGMQDGQVTRIDLILEPDARPEVVQEAVATVLKKLHVGAVVRTPEEQNHIVGNVMSGMQTGFLLCGLSALGVGLFLVYNSLAVSVAERRHEIGVLLSVGATRRQVLMLFAGEAALMGVIGSLLGIPLGLGLAALALQPVQQILAEIFYNIDARHLEISREMIGMALVAGTVTAVAAALFPAFGASRENPAEAVRRVAKPATGRHHLWQLVLSLLLITLGALAANQRDSLLPRVRIYGGLMLIMLGTFLLTPLLTAVAARIVQPFFRKHGSIEWRLAADNLVRSPGRTGLVVTALAAGVALVLQTAGTIVSNRTALREWVQSSFTSDLIITGSPISAGGSSDQMDPALEKKLRATFPAEVEDVLPLRQHKVQFRGTHEIMINAIAADRVFSLDQKRSPFSELSERQRAARQAEVKLYDGLAARNDGVIISENFAAIHGLDKGDTITLTSTKKGEVTLTIIGKVVDYSWNHGTLFIDLPVFLANWNDHGVDIFDVYLRQPTSIETTKTVKKTIANTHGLWVSDRAEVQAQIDSMIERLYGIAYGQQIVVMFIALVGVVTALLISVLQRRREMGLLRAIGASRWQVIRSVLAEAALMGVLGTTIGIIMGIPLQWYVLKVAILEESGYLFPVHIPWMESLIIAMAAIVAATLAGLGPAVHSVRQRIPDAIAYE